MNERWVSFLIWLFRIDEDRSYEEQPQWVIVLLLGTVPNPRVVPVWVGILMVAVTIWWLYA